ncbi:unnamed protein product [Microthlaspi erraticum]|uniref:Uncharacterized protein n=1 Tax=Microthlaspi erraticum TaxID=1685480 RepID=A0A6D2KXG2_9BRAS|nr:unnamed protein product [Microthlaspi erraticum]CAA7057992.1 unnamed protein product [Microthlaspi erraticum]
MRLKSFKPLFPPLVARVRFFQSLLHDLGRAAIAVRFTVTPGLFPSLRSPELELGNPKAEASNTSICTSREI